MADPADHAPTYALRDGDGWWYFLPAKLSGFLGTSTRITDDLGNDLERGHRQGWYYSPDPIAKILLHRERRGLVTVRREQCWIERDDDPRRMDLRECTVVRLVDAPQVTR